MLEKEHFPRFHLGESLLPMSLEVLDDLGVTPKFEARFIRKHGARFLEGASGDEVSFKFADARPRGSPLRLSWPARAKSTTSCSITPPSSAPTSARDGSCAGSPKRDARQRRRRASDPMAAKNALRRTSSSMRAAATRSRRAAQGCKVKIPRLERTLAVFSHYDGCQPP